MFKVEEVTSVYSGRKGCACGCRGKYTYRDAAHRPSYMTGTDGIDPKSMERMTRKIENIIHSGEGVCRILIDDEFIGIDMNHDRSYTLYFK